MSRNGYPRPREHIPYSDQQAVYDLNFARNQEYLPAGRDYAASKSWQSSNSSPYLYDTKNSWNRHQFAEPPDPKPWPPWHTQREYLARLEKEEEETAKAWQQAQQRQHQNWNRQNIMVNNKHYKKFQIFILS